MQVPTRFAEYNYELLDHQIARSLGEVYIWSRQIHTPNIYTAYHQPVIRMTISLHQVEYNGT